MHESNEWYTGPQGPTGETEKDDSLDKTGCLMIAVMSIVLICIAALAVGFTVKQLIGWFG